MRLSMNAHRARPGRYCVPRRPTHVQPSSIELNANLRRGLADIACHVNQRISSPRLLSLMAPYDLANNNRQGLP
jgi:hypothetical protein